MEQLERDIRRERILGKRTNQQPTLHHFFNKKTQQLADDLDEDLATGAACQTNTSDVIDVEDQDDDDDSFSSCLASSGSTSSDVLLLE